MKFPAEYFNREQLDAVLAAFLERKRKDACKKRASYYCTLNFISYSAKDKIWNRRV
jgi:hypothetical protein